MKYLAPIVFVASLFCCGRTAVARCYLQSPTEALNSAKVIFVGRVISINDPTLPAVPLQSTVVDLVRPVTARFAVERVFRGDQVAEIVVATRTGGLEWGYEFKVGEKYLVYAHEGDQNEGFVVKPCGRTRPFSDAAEDLKLLAGASSLEHKPVSTQSTLGQQPKKPRTLEDYVPSTLKEIDTPNIGSDVSRTGTIHAFKVRANYAGISRLTSQNSKQALVRWTQCCAGNPDHYLKSYDTEMLFKSDGTDYWLPVNKQLLGNFANTFISGDPVDLYLIRVATEADGGDRSWVLLVETFTDANEERSRARLEAIRWIGNNLRPSTGGNLTVQTLGVCDMAFTEPGSLPGSSRIVIFFLGHLDSERVVVNKLPNDSRWQMLLQTKGGNKSIAFEVDDGKRAEPGETDKYELIFPEQKKADEMAQAFQRAIKLCSPEPQVNQ